MKISVGVLKSTTLSLSQLTYAIASLAFQARINISFYLHGTLQISNTFTSIISFVLKIFLAGGQDRDYYPDFSERETEAWSHAEFSPTSLSYKGLSWDYKVYLMSLSLGLLPFQYKFLFLRLDCKLFQGRIVPYLFWVNPHG